MAMKQSTKAKKLQDRIAYWMLAHRKRPPQIIVNKDWWTKSKVWHIADIRPVTQQPANHCSSCTCKKLPEESRYTTSICTRFIFDSKNYKYKYMQEDDFKDKRPCKSCLASLSMIARSGK